MNPQDILAIAVPVTAIVELSKRFNLIPSKYAPIFAAIIALIGVVLWAYSLGGFRQSLVFGYFAGWVAITVSAVGVYEITTQSLQKALGKTRSN